MVLGWYDFIFKNSISLANGMVKNRYSPSMGCESTSSLAKLVVHTNVGQLPLFLFK
jgi:hypothetical protein